MESIQSGIVTKKQRELVGYIGIRNGEPKWLRVLGADSVRDGYRHEEIAIYKTRAAAIRNETDLAGDEEVKAVKVRVILED